MSIRYDSENYYLENILYVSNPNLDYLKFHFFKECNRVFCRVESEIVMELNKEVVLNPLSKDLKRLKKIIEDFQEDDEATEKIVN